MQKQVQADLHLEAQTSRAQPNFCSKKHLLRRSMANLSGWDTSSSQDTLVGILLNKFTRASEVFKNNLKFIYEPKYKRTL